MTTLERVTVALIVIYAGMLIYASAAQREFNLDLLHPAQLFSATSSAQSQLDAWKAHWSAQHSLTPAAGSSPAASGTGVYQVPSAPPGFAGATS
jgi:hypothetical protein